MVEAETWKPDSESCLSLKTTAVNIKTEMWALADMGKNHRTGLTWPARLACKYLTSLSLFLCSLNSNNNILASDWCYKKTSNMAV